MAHSDIGGLGVWLQDAFQKNEGLKAFLEEVVQQVMSAEASAATRTCRA
jgi:hypothetical protein